MKIFRAYHLLSLGHSAEPKHVMMWETKTTT